MVPAIKITSHGSSCFCKAKGSACSTAISPACRDRVSNSKGREEKPEHVTMTGLTCLVKCLIIPDQVLYNLYQYGRNVSAPLPPPVQREVKAADGRDVNHIHCSWLLFFACWSKSGQPETSENMSIPADLHFCNSVCFGGTKLKDYIGLFRINHRPWQATQVKE